MTTYRDSYQLFKDRQDLNDPYNVFIRKLDRYLEVTYVILWTITLWVLLVAKVVSEGAPSYFYHYTNWNWTINTIYFTGDIITRCVPHGDVRVAYLGSLFWLVYGSNWSVFFLVFIMFADNPGVLTDLAKQNGGSYGMGFLLNMNTVFHSLPLIATLLYVFIAKKDISNMVGKLLGRSSNTNAVITFILIAFLFPIATIGMYSLCMDFQKVYGLDTSIGVMIGVVIGVVFVFNGFTILALYSKSARDEYRRYKKWNMGKNKNKSAKITPHYSNEQQKSTEKRDRIVEEDEDEE